MTALLAALATPTLWERLLDHLAVLLHGDQDTALAACPSCLRSELYPIAHPDGEVYDRCPHCRTDLHLHLEAGAVGQVESLAG
jgi:hypothetical protein